MVGKRKPFDEIEYRKSDKAKYLVGQILMDRGYYINIVEDYDADIFSIHGDTFLFSYHEVEVKKGWQGRWPLAWKHLQIPERKKRLIEKYGERLYFWVVCSDREKAFVVAANDVLGSPIHEVPNKNVAKDEYFFFIPIEKCKLWKLI